MIEDRFEPADDDGYIAMTTVTSFRIIEALERHEGVTVSELVDELGLASGTIYKHLNTLREIQYVNKEGHEYCLGLGFLELGITARAQTNLYEQTFDALVNLAETTGRATTLMVPEHDYGVYLTQIVPEGATRPPHQEGERVQLHATAGGKVILAHQSNETIEDWLADRELPVVTDSTITDTERLRQELESVRDRRMAYARGEQFEGWYSIAVPLTDGRDEAIGAVSIKTPMSSGEDATEMTESQSLLGSTVGLMESKLRQE